MHCSSPCMERRKQAEGRVHESWYNSSSMMSINKSALPAHTSHSSAYVANLDVLDTGNTDHHIGNSAKLKLLLYALLTQLFMADKRTVNKSTERQFSVMLN